MAKLDRKDIQIISRNSNWTANDINQALKHNVYTDDKAWHQFLKWFCGGLGIGFIAISIIFFFAYNWADLHPFIKLSIVQGLVIVAILLVCWLRINPLIRNLLLTAAGLLVGVMFAVFGQIYQTGANAYDFFLAWTIFISLWVWVANFPPFWLLYLGLFYTTVILFSQQVAHNLSFGFIVLMMFIINTAVLISFIGISWRKLKPAPTWFTHLIALGSIVLATIGICYGIHAPFEFSFALLVLFTTIFYALGVGYGLKAKSGFYLSMVPFSIIIMVTSLLLKISFDEAMIFFITLFIMGSVTLVIKNLLDFQKKWNKKIM
jgi:uncharacterized membrane protein